MRTRQRGNSGVFLTGKIDENTTFDTSDFRNLTSADLREIEDATSKISVYGARYPDELERRTGP